MLAGRRFQTDSAQSLPDADRAAVDGTLLVHLINHMAAVIGTHTITRWNELQKIHIEYAFDYVYIYIEAKV